MRRSGWTIRMAKSCYLKLPDSIVSLNNVRAVRRVTTGITITYEGGDFVDLGLGSIEESQLLMEKIYELIGGESVLQNREGDLQQ